MRKIGGVQTENYKLKREVQEPDWKKSKQKHKIRKRAQQNITRTKKQEARAENKKLEFKIMEFKRKQANCNGRSGNSNGA